MDVDDQVSTYNQLFLLEKVKWIEHSVQQPTFDEMRRAQFLNLVTTFSSTSSIAQFIKYLALHRFV